MVEETDKKTDAPVTEEKDSVPVAKKKSGLFSRIWNGLFHRHGDDYEKRLQNMDKKEAAILARIKRRARCWRGFAKNLVVLSLISEVVAVGYAIMTTRTLNMDWEIRALKVLPMFLLPALSTMIYLALGSFIRMRDRKDQSDLERLRTEMQESLDELKEKRNYYSLLELIQLLACLRILIRKCVHENINKDEIQTLFPKEVLPELQKLLTILLQKFQNEWREDVQQK